MQKTPPSGAKGLLTNSLIFFIGTFILSIFNYLYNTFMGRFLGPADYGIIGSLLAFISIITIPTNAVATVAMRFTAHYHAKDDDGAIHAFLRRLTKNLTILGVVIAVVIIATSGLLASFLHLPSSAPVMLIAPILIFAILLPLNRGILQGLQNFFQAIINQNIDPILKLGLGLLFVKIGWGVLGAIGAILIGATVSYAASFLPLLQPILSKPIVPIKSIPKEVKEFSALALVAFLLTTLLMNIDILLVKHFLPDHEAGLYTALSTIGKIILFVTTPVVSVMFPMISDLQGRDQKHYGILLQSLLLVAVIGLCGTAGYFLLPNLVVNILYGSAYLAIAPLLGLFGIVMFLFSIINLWVNYFLSIANKAFIWCLAVSVVVEIGLLLIHHDNFLMITESLLVAMVIGFVLLTCYYLYLKRAQLVERLAGRTLLRLD